MTILFSKNGKTSNGDARAKQGRALKVKTTFIYGKYENMIMINVVSLAASPITAK